MNFEEPIFRPPSGAGYFRVGTKSPKRRRSIAKPPVESRKKNYKRGINTKDNRKRRARFSRDFQTEKRRLAINNVRSGASDNSTEESRDDVEAKESESERKYEGTVKEKLEAFYKDHNPSKLGDVDKAMAKYAGNEDKLFVNLAKRYNVNPRVFGIDVRSTLVLDRKYEGTVKEKLLAFYKDHNPSKIGDVDKAMAKYVGNEEQLFVNLAKRYNVNPAVFGVDLSSSTPLKSNATGAFNAYTSTNNSTFGVLASPKAQAGGFGSARQASSDSKYGRGRTTITSLKTFTEELRVSTASDDDMDCD